MPLILRRGYTAGPHPLPAIGIAAVAGVEAAFEHN
jgi:hypothetical protein